MIRQGVYIEEVAISKITLDRAREYFLSNSWSTLVCYLLK